MASGSEEAERETQDGTHSNNKEWLVSSTEIPLPTFHCLAVMREHRNPSVD